MYFIHLGIVNLVSSQTIKYQPVHSQSQPIHSFIHLFFLSFILLLYYYLLYEKYHFIRLLERDKNLPPPPNSGHPKPQPNACPVLSCPVCFSPSPPFFFL